MLITKKRPRDLHWYHAGPLLFGDWGTSRLYVLGLAFFYTAHASIYYLALLSVLMAAVAWCYTIVCRNFPEGGGVYTAARQIHPFLSVIGATLLIADYIVTACLSSVEAFHYFGANDDDPVFNVRNFAIVTILLLGVVNWFGAKSAGRLALIVAVLSMAFSAVIGLLSLRFIPEGLRTIDWGPPKPPWDRWQSFVHIVLALSGVEAVANMTGLMKEPVNKTAKKTIWPVLAEVAVLNLVFGLAIAGLPALAHVHVPHAELQQTDPAAYAQLDQDDVNDYKNTAMKVLAIEAGQAQFGEHPGFVFGKIAAIAFGLLLLSACNTAIMAMVSVMFAMSHDRELPRGLGKLNYSGVPWVGLVVAVAVVIVVLLFETDVARLADLYAIGVTGAITINLISCALNKGLDARRWERIGLWTVGVLIGLVWITIAITKIPAAIFAGSLIALVLVTRFIIRRTRAADSPLAHLPEPVTGWLAEIKDRPLDIGEGPRIMLAARGLSLAEYAVGMARERRGTLFAVFVRTLRVMDMNPGSTPRIEDDRDALASLGTIALVARQHNVPFVPIYVCSAEIAEEILDYTVTFACDTLIMGKTRRNAFSRALQGDVVQKIAAHLPHGVTLITREASPDDGAAHPIEPGSVAQ